MQPQTILIKQCAWCNRIQVEQEWVHVPESVIASQGHELTHGICPDCVEEHYPHLSLTRMTLTKSPQVSHY